MNEQINLIPNEQLGELQKIALSKALAMLRGAGAKYIVVLPGGTELVHGDLKLAPPGPTVKPRTRKQLVPTGTYKNAYDPYLRGLQVGQTVRIPYNGLDPDGLQAASSAWCSKNWGSGTAMSHKANDALEIMRVS